MTRGACLLLAGLLLLGACGRAGPPRRPGPEEAITYPRRIYPAPDPVPLPPPSAAGPVVLPAPLPAPATAPPPAH